MFGPRSDITYAEANQEFPLYVRWLIEDSQRVDRLSSKEHLRFVHWIFASGQKDRMTGRLWKNMYQVQASLVGTKARELNFQVAVTFWTLGIAITEPSA